MLCVLKPHSLGRPTFKKTWFAAAGTLQHDPEKIFGILRRQEEPSLIKRENHSGCSAVYPHGKYPLSTCSSLLTWTQMCELQTDHHESRGPTASTGWEAVRGGGKGHLSCLRARSKKGNHPTKGNCRGRKGKDETGLLGKQRVSGCGLGRAEDPEGRSGLDRILATT